MLVSLWTTLLVLYLLFTALPAFSGVAVFLLLILAGLVFFGLARFTRPRKALSALLFTQGACFGGYALAMLVVTLLVRLRVL